MPIGALFTCIFVGWIWGAENAIKEATSNGEHFLPFQNIWKFLIKWILPIAIAAVFVQGLFLL
ncbi:hypothetical protein PRVXT_002397 [Proteinivorax tanatarense]|uniref:Sodium-dependent transporter n=1 Tax=Proteinivorax tanatarense TaxID=1260629 RepID=A0AAU7VJY3_9FIRM